MTENGIDRVVLASDGVANVGLTDPDGILRSIRQDASAGIELVSVGVGMGNYNDALLERLADQGDGFYAYVNDQDEARRLFTEDLTGTLQTVALDARAQVEFDPESVVAYRLLGYENRAIDDRDFTNDSVQAGAIGAGHTVTALYAIRVREDAGPQALLATIRLRWTDPDRGGVGEVARDPRIEPGTELPRQRPVLPLRCARRGDRGIAARQPVERRHARSATSPRWRTRRPRVCPRRTRSTGSWICSTDSPVWTPRDRSSPNPPRAGAGGGPARARHDPVRLVRRPPGRDVSPDHRHETADAALDRGSTAPSRSTACPSRMLRMSSRRLPRTRPRSRASRSARSTPRAGRPPATGRPPPPRSASVRRRRRPSHRPR